MDYYLVSKLISLGLSILYLPVVLFVWFKYKKSNKREMEYLDYLARRIDAVERNIREKEQIEGYQQSLKKTNRASARTSQTPMPDISTNPMVTAVGLDTVSASGSSSYSSDSSSSSSSYSSDSSSSSSSYSSDSSSSSSSSSSFD